MEADEIKVSAQILRLAAKGSNEEELRELCQMQSPVLESYLSALAELRFLSIEEKTPSSYRTTRKGLEFLHMYHRLRWLLWSDDDDLLLMRLLGQLGEQRQAFYVS
jgi:predicted transcriptional regulator